MGSLTESSSSRKMASATSTGTMVTGSGQLHSICFSLSPGANSPTLILYDNTSASGTEIWRLKIPGETGSVENTSLSVPWEFRFSTGVHFVVSGAVGTFGSICINYD